MLLSFYIICDFPNFLLLLISSFIPWWLENLLNLLKIVLWPNVSSILKNIPCVLEKSGYSVVGLSVLQRSVRSLLC